VLRVGALPVLADVEEDTLCLSAQAARAAITPATRAIIPVHLHHSAADMDAFQSLSKETGIPILEDCAQAHGALWRGRRVGTLGRLGAFSFQQSKVLTSGEGGAAITDDPELYDRLQMLRADSRCWRDEPRLLDGMQLVSTGKLLGANYCLSEIQAAILLAQLPGLDDQLKRQADNAAYLDEKLSGLGLVRPLRQPDRLDRRTVYEYIVRLDPQVLGACPNEWFCQALQAETGLRFYPPDAPLHRSPLYRPETKPKLMSDPARRQALDTEPLSFPVAEAAHKSGVVCHHAAFLGGRSDVDDIASAFAKVLDNLDGL
jgi:dTDP-4-amino-4,6-dideoxygalactose transaminase